MKGFEIHSERCKTNLKSLGRDVAVAASEEWGTDVGPSPEIYRLTFLAREEFLQPCVLADSGLGWL